VTLGQWLDKTWKALGSDSAAVQYLKDRIALAPEGVHQEVPGKSNAIRLHLMQIHVDGEKRAQQSFEDRLQSVVAEEMRLTGVSRQQVLGALSTLLKRWGG
jgi:hypothetical protein